jgi:hypothetical protein
MISGLRESKNMDVLSGIVMFIVATAIGAVCSALPVMWLWNVLMPDIFGLTQIGFFQALGIALLSGCLFKSSSSSSKNNM